MKYRCCCHPADGKFSSKPTQVSLSHPLLALDESRDPTKDSEKRQTSNAFYSKRYTPDYRWPKMPSSFEKTRKQIQKKRNGSIDALHQLSRDSRRLHKANVRDQRLDKLAASRGKREQPICS